MYIILNKKVENLDLVNGVDYSISTYMKRFFTEDIEELAMGGRAYSNYEFGDALYFYEIKDSLRIKDLSDGRQQFEFKIFSELDYKDLVRGRKKSLLRLFRFIERIDDILEYELKEKALNEFIDVFNFMELADVYKYLINKREEYSNNKEFDNFMSLYEELMIKKSYKDASALDSFYKLISNNSINKDMLVNRFKSIITNQKDISQELCMLSESLLWIDDKSMSEELLLAYIEKMISMYDLDKEFVGRLLKMLEKDIHKINDRRDEERFNSVLELISTAKIS